MNRQALSEALSSFRHMGSTKRFEENVKFVFKLTIKKLKQNFLNQRRFLNFSKRREMFFYRYYFERISRETRIPLNAFYEPLVLNAKHKTLNKDYIRLVMRAEGFRGDFWEYIRSGELRDDYQKCLFRKLTKLLQKFERVVRGWGRRKSGEGITRIRSYFQKNKQSKLPWTENEITGSIDCLVDFVESN